MPMLTRLLEAIATRFFKATGGRPMVREECAFVDAVVGREVWYYRDRMGRRWLAFAGLSTFRVPAGNQEANLDLRLWRWRRDR